MSDFHRCPAPGCQVRVPDDRLACPAHWYALPKDIRDQVWRAFRDHGQGSVEHTLAINKGIAYMRRHATRHVPRFAR